MKTEAISLLLARIGDRLGAKFSLDSRGVMPLSYAGNRKCVFAAQDGFSPRVGMAAALIPHATDEQILRAVAMNANFERESGVLALDDMGAIIFTAARDAGGLSEEALADFMSDFIEIAIEVENALKTERARAVTEVEVLDAIC